MLPNAVFFDFYRAAWVMLRVLLLWLKPWGYNDHFSYIKSFEQRNNWKCRYSSDGGYDSGRLLVLVVAQVMGLRLPDQLDVAVGVRKPVQK
jgi:hypothetical protein